MTWVTSDDVTQKVRRVGISVWKAQTLQSLPPFSACRCIFHRGNNLWQSRFLNISRPPREKRANLGWKSLGGNSEMFPSWEVRSDGDGRECFSVDSCRETSSFACRNRRLIGEILIRGEMLLLTDAWYTVTTRARLGRRPPKVKLFKAATAIICSLYGTCVAAVAFWMWGLAQLSIIDHLHALQAEYQWSCRSLWLSRRCERSCSVLINAVPVSQRVSYLQSNDRRSHISTGDTAINYKDGGSASSAEEENWALKAFFHLNPDVLLTVTKSNTTARFLLAKRVSVMPKPNQMDGKQTATTLCAHERGRLDNISFLHNTIFIYFNLAPFCQTNFTVFPYVHCCPGPVYGCF